MCCQVEVEEDTSLLILVSLLECSMSALSIEVFVNVRLLYVEGPRHAAGVVVDHVEGLGLVVPEALVAQEGESSVLARHRTSKMAEMCPIFHFLDDDLFEDLGFKLIANQRKKKDKS